MFDPKGFYVHGSNIIYSYDPREFTFKNNLKKSDKKIVLFEI